MPVPGFVNGVNSCLGRTLTSQAAERGSQTASCAERALGIRELSSVLGGTFGDVTTFESSQLVLACVMST